MENLQESKNLIADSKNIYLVPDENPEAITSALSLFYSLNDLDKKVNLIIENIPENLKFLTPSLDFISYPKNFIISIPSKTADISQISYEKNEEAVKIFLTLEKGKINKDDISLYLSESKPDLVITLGIKDYSEQLKGRLNDSGFLLDAPVLNIDSLISSEQNNMQKNKKFGKINIVEEKPLLEITMRLINNLSL